MFPLFFFALPSSVNKTLTVPWLNEQTDREKRLRRMMQTAVDKSMKDQHNTENTKYASDVKALFLLLYDALNPSRTMAMQQRWLQVARIGRRYDLTRTLSQYS